MHRLIVAGFINLNIADRVERSLRIGAEAAAEVRAFGIDGRGSLDRFDHVELVCLVWGVGGCLWRGSSRFLNVYEHSFPDRLAKIFFGSGFLLGRLIVSAGFNRYRERGYGHRRAGLLSASNGIRCSAGRPASASWTHRHRRGSIKVVVTYHPRSTRPTVSGFVAIRLRRSTLL